jgi:hypothetical protein
MSALTDLVGGIVSGLGDTAIKIRTAITGKDPALDAKLAQLALELESKKSEAETALLTGQLEINKVEAASESGFKSNWRPAVAWICVLAFLINYLVYPILMWILKLARVEIELPQMDVGTMVPILVAMLGLGAYRSYDKVQAKK